jgi:hypothetical protein
MPSMPHAPEGPSAKGASDILSGMGELGMLARGENLSCAIILCDADWQSHMQAGFTPRPRGCLLLLNLG